MTTWSLAPLLRLRRAQRDRAQGLLAAARREVVGGLARLEVARAQAAADARMIEAPGGSDARRVEVAGESPEALAPRAAPWGPAGGGAAPTRVAGAARIAALVAQARASGAVAARRAGELRGAEVTLEAAIDQLGQAERLVRRLEEAEASWRAERRRRRERAAEGEADDRGATAGARAGGWVAAVGRPAEAAPGPGEASLLRPRRP